LPTPAVALLARRHGFDLAAAVTASHNPASDDGVKLLGRDGGKVPDAFERAVEALLVPSRPGARPRGRSIPPVTARTDAAAEYADLIRAEFADLRLRGARVVLDAADGAAGEAAPAVLRALGAEVFEVRCGGNGARINDRCGALHPEAAGRAVRRARAHLGIALDGDGDRAILLDAAGLPRDGDDVLAALAPALRARRRLPGAAVVGTVMANGGLEAHLRRSRIALVRVPVGDRFVAEALRRRGLALGAEPSGHCLFPRDGLLTSDGLVTGLRVLREMAAAGASLARLLRGFERVPRAEAAVPVGRRPDLDRHAPMRTAIRAAEAAAGPGGRVLVRYSGTEPKVRILVESTSAPAARRACDALAAAARSLLA
ncbi:MAG TPA: phosphoglucosamine mutase, partial [Planctomycetota bacterium]|nr:phosphoglucosamine mutase [Planctomycetota bacterium]